MLKKLTAFQKRTQKLHLKKERIPNDVFYLYLNMISSIMYQGLTDQMKVCVGDPKKIKDRLTRMNVKDAQSLDGCLHYNYQCGEQYQQFLTFWDGKPCFDIEKQSDRVKTFIRHCEAYAKQFYPLTKRFGFYAWDISEAVFLIRCAYTCEYLSESKAQQRIQYYVDLARRYFTDFNDYAISYLCGCMYYMMRESGNEALAEKLTNTALTVCHYLFFEKDRIWAKTSWLILSDYFKSLKIVEDRGLKQGNAGCIVSNRISVDECSIKYFYREKAISRFPDSGWRFLAGDESEAYLSDAKNAHVFALNTIANVCPDIIPFLDQPVGSAYLLGEDGSYHLLPSKEVLNDE